MIDYEISSLLLIGLIQIGFIPDHIASGLNNPEISTFQNYVNWSFFGGLLWVIVEPMVLFSFSTTPGKALFRLRLLSISSKPKYWSRSFAVWAVGLGFCLPSLSGLLALRAAGRLKKNGQSDWDKWTGFIVVPEPLGVIRKTSLTLLSVVVILIGYTNNAKAPNQIPNQLVVEETQLPSNTTIIQDTFQQANNLFGERRYAEAFPLFWQLAVQGNANAQNGLGWIYLNGLGVVQDNSQAVYWYRKSGEQGHAVSQNNLGNMYQNGLGVTQDNSQAIYWYQKAAEQGQQDAIDSLKQLLSPSLDKQIIPSQTPNQLVEVKQLPSNTTNIQDAVQQTDNLYNERGYQKAADQGNTNAQFNRNNMAGLGDFITTLSVCITP